MQISKKRGLAQQETTVVSMVEAERANAAVRPLRVCYFGAYRATYSRNRIMIEGLRRNDVHVVECHEALWAGIEDRVQAVSGGWKKPAFWLRVLRTYTRLLRKYWPLRNQYDVLVVGYPGQFDVYLARLLSWWARKPLVWDIFMSIYLIALERGLDQRSRFTINLLRIVERWACRLPNRLILDTAEYVTWFGETHGVPAEHFRLTPTGADSSRFHPLPTAAPCAASRRCTVLYYGSYIPNHGVAAIVEAARLLAGESEIRFEMIGQGPDRQHAQEQATQSGLSNIVFIDWLDQADLVKHIGCADICLGAFGQTPQSLMTVQNKIYECMAMGKAVISGDGPAVRQAFCDGEQIVLCTRGDGQALAEAIRRLQRDPTLRQRVAEQGHAAFVAHYTVEKLGERLRGHIEELLTP